MSKATLFFFLCLFTCSINCSKLRIKAKQSYASSHITVFNTNGKVPDTSNKSEYIEYIKNQPERCNSGDSFDFSSYNSRTLCGGSDRDIGYFIQLNICVPYNDGRFTFYIASDLEKGIAYFDDDVNSASVTKSFYVGNWNNKNAWVVKSPSLKRGKHTFTIYANEGCCDGTGQIYYATDANPSQRPVNLVNLREDCKEYESSTDGVRPWAESQLIIKDINARMPKYTRIDKFVNYILDMPERCRSGYKFDFENFNGRKVCGGYVCHTGFRVKINFCLPQDETVTFYVAADFEGAISWFNDDTDDDQLYLHASYYAPKWEDANTWIIKNQLPRGEHKFRIVAGDNCCDGMGQLYYSTETNPVPRPVNFDNLNQDCKELNDPNELAEALKKKKALKAIQEEAAALEAELEGPELHAARKAVLEAHNIKRKIHHADDLVLDSKLNKHAQEYAERLAKEDKFYHDGGQLEEFMEGENLYLAGGSSDPVNAVGAWYQEIADYDFSLEVQTTKKATGHFTQLVWKGSSKLGVGVAKANGKTYVVARYAPPGNWEGEYRANVLKAD